LWESCWSVARVQLGLTDGEFFALTPRQFHLLVDQHRERVEHQELLSGIIASTVANWSMTGPRKALTPSDFMPSRRQAKAEQKKKPRVNRKRIADRVRSFLTHHMEQSNG
jgi:hypothetical protein